jgi:hypothetical protein
MSSVPPPCRMRNGLFPNLLLPHSAQGDLVKVWHWELAVQHVMRIAGLLVQ